MAEAMGVEPAKPCGELTVYKMGGLPDAQCLWPRLPIYVKGIIIEQPWRARTLGEFIGVPQHRDVFGY